MNEIKNRVMTLITKSQMEQLIKAGYEGTRPVVKLFCCQVTWLVTGIEDGILYGYGCLEQGCVEWGGLCHVDELAGMKVGPFYFERDYHFVDKVTVEYGSLDSLVGI
jgi:hypothetical protein